MSEPESLTVGTINLRLGCKEEFSPILAEMAQRLEACQAELKAIGMLFIDHLSKYLEYKGFEEGAPPISEDP